MTPLRPSLLPALLVSACIAVQARAQELHFSVIQGDDVVGSIVALRQHPGENATYVVSSASAMVLLKRQEVQSTLATAYRDRRPFSCFTALRVNGTLRDSSLMRPSGRAFSCFVLPKHRFTLSAAAPWSTARMYFEEPVGQHEVFVESVLRNCPLVHLGNGEYRVVLPEGKSNIYRYRKGELTEVHVNRTFLKLVFRRIA
jgi:hypothetical protein